MLSPTLQCKHSNKFHLFHVPLCRKQTLLRKISNVAFHILTLGIPLAFYRVITCCFPRIALRNGDHGLRGKAIENVQRKNQEIMSIDKLDRNKNQIVKEIANPEYLFLARKAGRSQEGCCGSISVERADAVRHKLQERAAPGISFDSAIYHQCPAIIGTCTAMSLEFASTYFRLRKEWKNLDPGSEPFLEKIRLVSGNFETSSEEMRSRQSAFSSITVDRMVNMDVSKNKIESCIKYHDFETDHCSKELDITTEAGLLQQEIDTLPHGIYFIRMLKPGDNHKLETKGHSMIYVHEEGVGFFYDNNCGLEKISSAVSKGLVGTLLCERLLNVHRQWDIPMVRFYRLKQK